MAQLEPGQKGSTSSSHPPDPIASILHLESNAHDVPGPSWESLEHDGEPNMGSTVSLPPPTTVNKLSQGGDIVIRGLSQLHGSWNESTDELLANPVSDYYPPSSSRSSTVPSADNILIASVDENTSRGAYILPIERAIQRIDNLDTHRTNTDETTGRRDLDSSRNSATPTLGFSEQDIEMDDMTPPRIGMQSTDELVPSTEEPEVDTIPPAEQSPPCMTSPRIKPDQLASHPPLPDYKPVPLRWPFQALLVVMIAGLFAFFEHQIRYLPPVRYKMFHVNPPEREKGTVAAMVEAPVLATKDYTSSYPRPTPVARRPVYTKTASGAGSALGCGVQILAATPDPRPPADDFPKPVKLISTYCGWAPPVWVLYTSVDYPTYSVGQGIGSRETLVVVEQTFPTFWSEDESWCPCLVEVMYAESQSQPASWPWDSGWATHPATWGRDFYVSTHDEECRSILSALYHWNMEHWHTSVLPSFLLLSVNIQELSAELTVSEQPVSQVPWPWPTTDSQGQVLLPFLVSPRDAPDVEDEFGNSDLPDFFWNAWTTVFDPEWSMVWWTLPFARPLSMSSTRAEEQNKITGSIHSSGSILLPSEQQTIHDTTAGHGTDSQKSSSSENSIVTGSSTQSMGTSVSGSTKEPAVTIPSNISETRGLKLSATATLANTRTFHSHSFQEGPTSHKDGGKEQSAAETSVPTDGTVTSFPAEQRHSTAATEHSSPTENELNASLPASPLSSDNPNLFTSAPLKPNTEQNTNVETLGESNHITVIVTHSTFYSLPLGRDPKFRLSSSDGIEILPSLDKSPKSSIPNPTATFPEQQPPATDDAVNPHSSTHYPGPIPPGSAALFTNLHSEADFLMASLIPVLLATVLAIAVQVFTSSLSSMLPFRGLGHGALLHDSLILSRTTGILTTPSVSFRFLRRYRDPLPLLNGLLSLLSILLVPLSSEAIRLEISTTCRPGSRPGLEDSPLVVCAYGLRKSGATMRLSEGILVAIVILIITQGYLLLRWNTAVASEPWSIASLVALMSDYELKSAIQSVPSCAANGAAPLENKEVRRAIGERRQFRIGYYERSIGNGTLTTELVYGINEILATGCDSSIRLTIRDPPERTSVPSYDSRKWWRAMTPYTTDLVIRGLALSLTTGLLVLILYYENTISPETKFEEFMNSQSFGVRILFTALGTAISWFWDDYYSQMSSNYVYQRLAVSERPQPARTSILLSTQPMDPFTAIYRSITPSRNIPLLAVAVVRLFAKITPILFSGIPFRNTITFTMHEACTWMAIAILFLMLVVLLQDILVPIIKRCFGRKGKLDIHMPVKVDTIAGCMYYLCGSNMLKDFEGLSLMRRRERDKLICEMGRRYAFRETTGTILIGPNNTDRGGVSEKEARRMRVDYVEAFEERTNNHATR